MSIKEQLEDLLAPLLEDKACFLVDISIKPSKASQKVTILIDSDEGVTIDQCTSISRQLAKKLEELDLFSDAYTLEVSSPGLDQPLVLARQYAKNVGRNLKVTLKAGQIVQGTLVEAAGENITLRLAPPKKKSKTPVDESELLQTIALDDIAKALVEVSFK
jgi:ribosome maturation factor RimP